MENDLFTFHTSQTELFTVNSPKIKLFGIYSGIPDLSACIV